MRGQVRVTCSGSVPGESGSNSVHLHVIGMLRLRCLHSTSGSIPHQFEQFSEWAGPSLEPIIPHVLASSSTSLNSPALAVQALCSNVPTSPAASSPALSWTAFLSASSAGLSS